MIINIRNAAARTRWDMPNPHVRTLNSRILVDWTNLSQRIQDAVRTADNEGTLLGVDHLSAWLHDNTQRCADAMALDEDCVEAEHVMLAYLEWGVRNIPFSTRVTEMTLAYVDAYYTNRCTESYESYDAYCDAVRDVLKYQVLKNTKPWAAMNRAEMLRYITLHVTDTDLKAMLK